MCKSAAEGGQRCVSEATTRMVNAQSRYEKAQANADAAAGKGMHEHFVRKAVAAFTKFETARIEYASTPQGEADLRNRLAAALNGTPATPGRTPDGLALDNPVDLETAIISGRLMRQRNERTRQRFLASGGKPARRTRAHTTGATKKATTARKRPAATAPTWAPSDGDIVKITTGTADQMGVSYLPEGAYGRVRAVNAPAKEGDAPTILIERVRMPGDKGEDEYTAGYERTHNGSYYTVPATAVGAPGAGDTTVEYFTKRPDESGDDYTGDEYLDPEYTGEDIFDEWGTGHASNAA